MKKLNFVLKNNNLEIINTVCEYYSDENSLSFCYENLKLVIRKDKNIVSFLRISENDSLEISKSDNKIKAVVKISNPELSLPIRVDEFNNDFKDNRVIINYVIESDEGLRKTIILSLMN